jgi:putative polyketide hydroxylase
MLQLLRLPMAWSRKASSRAARESGAATVTAGLAAALELAGRGLTPLILERRPASGCHPRATALSAVTMQLISRWGCEPQVRRLGFHVEHAMSIRSCLTGPEIRRVPFPGHVWACAQDHLETILAKRAATAGARLRYGAELTGLHPGDGEMLATVAVPPGPLTTIRARYVVGADGAHSTVRQAAGIATSRARAFGDWISILFRSPLRDYTGDSPCMVYGISDPSAGGVIVPPTPPTAGSAASHGTPNGASASKTMTRNDAPPSSGLPPESPTCPSRSPTSAHSP